MTIHNMLVLVVTACYGVPEYFANLHDIRFCCDIQICALLVVEIIAILGGICVVLVRCFFVISVLI